MASQLAVGLAFRIPSVFTPYACQSILARCLYRPAGAAYRFRPAATALGGLFGA